MTILRGALYRRMNAGPSTEQKQITCSLPIADCRLLSLLSYKGGVEVDLDRLESENAKVRDNRQLAIGNRQSAIALFQQFVLVEKRDHRGIKLRRLLHHQEVADTFPHVELQIGH